MQDSRRPYTPNPLRPYYIPPSTHLEPSIHGAAAAHAAKPSTASSFAFPDIDYSDYISDASPSLKGTIKSYVDAGVWKYTSVVMAQPFEVAKLILQVRVAQEDDLDSPRRHSVAGGHIGGGGGGGSGVTEDYDQDHSSDDEPNYFSSAGPFEQPTASRSPPRGRRRAPRQHNAPPSQYHNQTRDVDEMIHLKSPHSLLDALSALSSRSGALAMWRATNSTFLYQILTRTLETFFRGFLAALCGIAENDVIVPGSPGTIPDTSILSSTTPVATVLIATAASALSALVLAPVDAARTRLILTPSTHEPRTLLGTIRTLPTSWLIPGHLVPITFLTSTLPVLISTSTPVFLKSYLGLDPALNPAGWSMATFVSSALDLSVKFPLETVLRRAQIATWTAPPHAPPAASSKRKAITTIVPVPQSYRGVLPTIWGIVREEGFSESHKDKTAALMGKAPRRKRRGQGVEGLYRGWRVGFWGLVGVWGTSFVGGLQGGVEPTAEGPSVHGGKF